MSKLDFISIRTMDDFISTKDKSQQSFWAIKYEICGKYLCWSGYTFLRRLYLAAIFKFNKKYLLHWFLWKLIKYFKYAHACTFLTATLLSFDRAYVSKTKIVTWWLHMQQIPFRENNFCKMCESIYLRNTLDRVDGKYVQKLLNLSKHLL